MHVGAPPVSSRRQSLESTRAGTVLARCARLPDDQYHRQFWQWQGREARVPLVSEIVGAPEPMAHDFFLTIGSSCRARSQYSHTIT
ncbi:MAG: hypothetical protein QF498_01485 [Arenicellales bacterium]|nr:hypothetical protein [Arenicellales bacterium]MDP6672686.1 hypothetical protein [Arenicellales bacterium]